MNPYRSQALVLFRPLGGDVTLGETVLCYGGQFPERRADMSHLWLSSPGARVGYISLEEAILEELYRMYFMYFIYTTAMCN